MVFLLTSNNNPTSSDKPVANSVVNNFTIVTASSGSRLSRKNTVNNNGIGVINSITRTHADCTLSQIR